MENEAWENGPRAGEAIAAELIRRRQKIDQEELEFSYLAAKFAATDEYDWQGFESPIAWLKASCHLSGGAASARICAGQQVEHLSQSSKAMADGEIGFAHFALIARTSAAVGERLDEGKLLGQARKQTIARFHDSCYHARHAADPQGCAADEAQGVEARSLTFANSDDGMVYVNGMLDKVGGAAVQAALEPLAQRTGKDDDRCRERRVADALVEGCMHSLETLLGLSGATAAEMDFSLPISAKAVERLACDCTVTRVLLGSDSTVIDVGRARRVISGAQGKALRVRDRGCVWPGCDRPATWTSGHHLLHWINGGATDLSNLVLICYRHHWMVHEGEWQIVRADDGRMLTIPPITPYQRLARGPD